MNDTTTPTPTAGLGEVTIVRVYEAPRELVFECMITPEHLTHFWGPIGVSTPLETIEIDARPGGIFKTVMVNDENGEQYPTSGVFIEVDAPSKLAWIEPEVEGGMTNTSYFKDLGDGRTEVTIHQTNVPEMYRSPEAQAGMQSSLDKFAAYVKSL
jgi:uncharacterized protein YndB with AHSA1/START domain